jgi:hypothetical protein
LIDQPQAGFNLTGWLERFEHNPNSSPRWQPGYMLITLCFTFATAAACISTVISTVVSLAIPQVPEKAGGFSVPVVDLIR